MAKARLVQIELPEFGMPAVRPELPIRLYPARVAALRERAEAAGYDRILVYSDREHSANLAYLSGFDPRFEEAMMVLAPSGKPAILVGNENTAIAAAAPLDMRVVIFQHFSLPGQPRDRTAPFKEILAAEGVGPGSRIGVIGWKTYPTPDGSTSRHTSSTSSGGGPARRVGSSAHGAADRRDRRSSCHQRGGTARRLRIRLMPDVRRNPPRDRGFAPGHDRGRGVRLMRCERHAALVPRDADGRPTRHLRHAHAEQQADTARRPVHDRVRSMGALTCRPDSSWNWPISCLPGSPTT